MKMLIDQGLPRSAATLLQGIGIDAVHVGDISMATAEDTEILQRGRDDQRIVVTLDADFHAHLALTGASTPSVIRIRIEGLRAEGLTALIQMLLPQCEAELEQGAVVTVQEGRIRIRRLPLLPQS